MSAIPIGAMLKMAVQSSLDSLVSLLIAITCICVDGYVKIMVQFR